jgi:hypothetical protein
MKEKYNNNICEYYGEIAALLNELKNQYGQQSLLSTRFQQ